MILLEIIYIPHTSSLLMILLGIIHIPHLLSLTMIPLRIIHIPHLPSLIMILLNIICIGLHLNLLHNFILPLLPRVLLLLLRHIIMTKMKRYVIHLSLISLVTMIMDNIIMHTTHLFLRVLLILCLCLKVMGHG